MEHPKILVGAPVFDGIPIDEWLDLIRNLSYPNYDIFLVDNSLNEDFSKYIKEKGIDCLWIGTTGIQTEDMKIGRNFIRKKVLEGGYDYYMSIEQDVFPPKDVIERLLKNDKDIVGFPYYIRFAEDYKPLCVMTEKFVQSEHGFIPEFLPAEEIINQFRKVHAIGLGCVLIKRKVLEEIEFKIFQSHGFSYLMDDMWFYIQCRAKGFEVWVDGSEIVRHDQDWKIKWAEKPYKWLF